jgi:single-strand DNA-binding protein
MFDTNVTIVGNVLTAPEWRRTTQSGTLVANFKVASTARRLDRESGRWVDGNSLRVRVNCWRKLAEGVASSVMVGDPVVVVGRMYTRDWVDDAGNHRTLYELEAAAVGHDLSRGRGKFLRNRPSMATSSIEDDEAENRVHGEATESVADEEAPARPEDRQFDDDPDFRDAPVAAGFHAGVVAPGSGVTGQGGGRSTATDELTLSDDLPLPDGHLSGPYDGPRPGGDEPGGDEPGGDEPDGDESEPDPLPETRHAGEPTTDDPVAAGVGSVRARRGRNRVPVPA